MKNVKKTNRLKKRIIALTLSVFTAVILLTSCNSAPSKNNASDSSKSSDNSLAIESQKVVDSPKWLKKLDAAKDCDQLIVVAGVGKST